MSWKGIIEQYRAYLPVSPSTPVVSLLEGNTPLIDSVYLSKLTSTKIYLKYEGLNPTGSFKDRGMTMAISKAVEKGARAVICASTGNTSASAAAYSARAGLKCAVLIPNGAIAMGKLGQALVHNAKVLPIMGNFDDALEMVKQAAQKSNIEVVNSINPYRLEGQKTGAFEICDVLGRAPDFHAIPVGNAGNISAYWQGYQEYFKHKKISNRPRMLGFQAEGAAPIVHGAPIKDPKTVATAIRIGNPASWKKALEARQESGGVIDFVTDKEILEAYSILARKEGVFVEPASAASVAGVIKLAKQKYFEAGSTVVCVLTGHGLKDPDCAIGSVPKPKEIPAKIEAILEAIES